MPTRDAAAYAVLTLLLVFVALNLQAGWVYAVDAVLIGFALAGWIAAFLATRPLHVIRTLPGEVFEGERVAVTLSLAPVKFPRFFLTVRDSIPGCDEGAVFVPFLWRKGVDARYEVIARRRGIHRMHTVELRSEGVTGLFRSRRTLSAPGTVTVFPRYDALPAFPLPGRSGAEMARTLRAARTGVDVAGVRDFREGDDPTHIHWRSTARRGQLVVREFEREVEPEATLIIDTRPSSSDEAGFEQLIRAAASVAHYATRRGQTVRLVSEHDRPVDVTGAGWTDTLRALAALERDGGRSPEQLYASVSAGTPAVIFTGDAGSIAPLAAAGTSVVAVLAGTSDRSAAWLEALGVVVKALIPGEEVGRCLAG